MKKCLMIVCIIFLSVAAAAQEKEKNFKLQPYGILWLHGWYNNAAMVGNDLVLYPAQDKDAKGASPNMGFSPRLTRLGLNITFPSVTSVILSGKVEGDFYGDYADSGWAEARPMPRLRHSILDIKKPFGDTTVGFLVGSTWSIVSSPEIYPAMINPGIGWAMGNLWQRMPQLRLYIDQKMGSINAGLIVAGARNMPGGSAHRSALLETKITSGDAAAMPQAQALAYAKGSMSDISFLVSGSTVYGKENYDDDSDQSTQGEADIFSIAASLMVAHKYAAVKGKFFTGKNLDTFGAGFGSPLLSKDFSYTDNDGNDLTGKEYVDGRSVMGYWAQLSIMPLGTSALSLNGGIGVDDPDEEETKDGSTSSVYYEKNQGIWGSVFYTMFESYTVGAQYLTLKTTKPGDVEMKADSIMFTFMLKFM